MSYLRPGLVVEVQINEAEYLPQPTSAGAGVRVHLSAPGTRPNPADSGYYVPPGFEMDLSFKLQTVSRLPTPHTSQCWDSWNATEFQPLYLNWENYTEELVDKYTYDVGTFEKSCLQYINKNI
jgi:hypothetical protein